MNTRERPTARLRGQRLLGLAGVAAFALLAPLGVVACSGGGGSSGGGGGELELEEFLVGRGVTAEGGLDVVSPLTFAEVDYETGLADPSTVRPIGPGLDPAELVSFPLGFDYHPPVVPRNGLLVLRFSTAIDPTSVRADEIGADGSVTEAGSVQVRDQLDRPVPVKLVLREQGILINPVVQGRVGFPPSPYVVDAAGNGIPDINGYLKIQFPSEPGDRLRSARGRVLGDRSDRLGEIARPLAFNPGNAALDFIEQNHYYPTEQRYNGNLPDDIPPRIVREYAVEASLDLAAGDSSSAFGLTDLDAGFADRAKGGRGEWAGARLVLRPGEPTAEVLLVASNTGVSLVFETPARVPLAHGESYRLTRLELFEPDPRDPIDPDSYDPWNPQNAANADLRSFLQLRRLDPQGEPVGPPLSPFQKIPSRCQFSCRFSEPMDHTSLLAFENFTVTTPASSGFALAMIGEIASSERETVVDFRPVLRDAASDTLQVLGLGPTPKLIKVSLITVPTVPFLMGRYNDREVAAILAEGWRALRDLGGQPLAHPPETFDPELAHVCYEASYETEPDPSLPDVGAIVHRFQGEPQVSLDPYTGLPGVTFRDVVGHYGPRVADVNLSLNGFLSGAPPEFFQKTHDDENPPDDLTMDTWPFGAGTPFSVFIQGKKSYAGVYGARFQALYRNKDCSPVPGVDGLALDLWRASWCPAGGTVEYPPDVFQNISVDVYHSNRNPPPSSTNGGLGAAFDPESYDNNVCSGNGANGRNWERDGTERRVVPALTTYTISRNDLFTPEKSSRHYEPWPEFKQLFAYDNTRSIVLEYRIRPQTTPVSFRNSFTFSVVSITVGTPRFRVFSLGESKNTLIPDPPSDKRAICAAGPQGGTTVFGDNMIYFMTFDFVKTVSGIESPFLCGDPEGLESPRWMAPLVSPSLDEQPAGTTTVLRFQGALNAAGDGPSEWVEDPAELIGYPFIRFGLDLTASIQTRHVPTFDLVVIPYRRGA
ncbi:MAG: hypothetical protein AB1486_10105 [Planctomycetota bacterium]